MFRSPRSLPRPLLTALAAFAMAPAALGDPLPTPAQVEEPAPPGFYPSAYPGQGDAHNCAHFTSQADAQAVLRADPTDPNRLDSDSSGIPGVACEANKGARDEVPVPLP